MRRFLSNRRRHELAHTCREHRQHVQESAQDPVVELARPRFCWSWPRASDGIRSAREPWHEELALAREAMNAGRYGLARERLSRLAEHWTDHGEVYLLLGECESRRGRREEALAAWAKVPPTAPSFARAARFRASSLIHMGKYSPAEELLLRALANPGAVRSLLTWSGS